MKAGRVLAKAVSHRRIKVARLPTQALVWRLALKVAATRDQSVSWALAALVACGRTKLHKVLCARYRFRVKHS